MDAGTVLFRNLDDICWSELEIPNSPYEFSGFTLDSGAKRTGRYRSTRGITSNPHLLCKWVSIQANANDCQQNCKVIADVVYVLLCIQ